MAETEIATLGLQVDVSGLERGIRTLEGLCAAAGKVERAMNDLGRTSPTEHLLRDMEGARTATNQLENAMSSLIRKVGGLATAFLSVKSAMSFMERGLNFNSSIEQAQIGMGSLITSMVKLNDVQGKALQGMQKYQAAQGMAKELMQEIQILGLKTTATTQSLVEGVQSIMGPALQAGMALKDIPKFAVAGAQAMQTLGVPLNQMRTELEALLSGNINKAQDILAPKLFADINGNVGEYIKKLKESGRLMEELTARLEPFRLAGADVAQTWSGLVSNLDEAMDKLAGDAANGFTKSMKEAVGVLSDLMLDMDTGTIKEEFQGIAQVLTKIENTIGQGIVAGIQTVADKVRDIGQFINNMGSDEFLKQTGDYALIAASGLTAMTLARKALTAQVTVGTGADAQQVTGLWAAHKAIQARAAAEADAATLMAVRARMEVSATQSIIASMTANKSAAEAERIRVAMQPQLTAALNNRAAAEARLTTAMEASTVAGRASITVGKAMQGVLGMFGGPLGLAITGATVGIMALATQTDRCKEATEQYTKAQQSFQSALQATEQAAQGATEEIKKITKAKQEAALQSNEKAWEAEFQAIKQGFAEVAITAEQFKASWNGMAPNEEQIKDIIPDDFVARFNTIINQFHKDGPAGVETFLASLGDFQTMLESNGLGATALHDRITEFFDSTDNGKLKIESLSEASAKLREMLYGVANAASVAKAEMAGGWNFDTGTAEGFIKKLQGQIRDAKLTTEGLKSFKEIGKVLPEIAPEQIGTAYKSFKKSGMNAAIEAIGNETFKSMTGERQKLLQQTFGLMQKTEAAEAAAASYGKTSSKAGKSAASAAHTAAVAHEDYTAKIAASEAQAAKLEVQLNKNASAEQALSLEKTRIEAEYQADLRKNAKEREQMAGKVSAAELKQYEIAQTKVSQMERDLKLRDAENQASQKAVQLANTQAKVIKDIGQLSGRHVDTLELQRAAISQQAKEYREVYHISEDIVAEWERLQLLQLSNDPFDAATRGVARFSSELSDTGKQWEDISYNFCKNFTSQTRSMFDEFLETGKVSFDGLQSLFKQLLKDLAWQALAQPIILSVVGGMAGASTGGSVSAGYAGSTGQAAGGSSGGILGMATQYGQQYAMKQLTGSNGLLGGVTGGITNSINDAMASWFPNTFATTANANLVGPMPAGIPKATFTQQAGSFLGNFATPAIGAGIGSMISPFANSLFGIQNNSGSQVGSMIGGLGATAILGTLAATNAWNPVGWVSGALAGLGALLGGGVGGLLGTQEKKEPKLDMALGANLWKQAGTEQTYYANGSPAKKGTDWSYSAAARTTNDATGEWGYLDYFTQVAKGTLEQSWAIADALGAVNKSFKQDYLASLEKQGAIYVAQTHQGSWINDDVINKSVQDFVDAAMGQIVTALGEVNLKPLTQTANGLAVRTVDDMAKAFTEIFQFVNVSAAIEDEDLQQKFLDKAIGQMTDALSGVSFAPLAKAADGFAADTLDELTKSLEDMFSLYDLSENIVDENAKAAFQSWAQKQIVNAFKGVDLSFLRVDFDKTSFAGMQQAYAASQAWKTVTDSIEGFLHPAGEVETTMDGVTAQFDQWIDTLRQLGWQEQAIAEIEAKRGEYLGEYRRQLENEMRQNLSLRYSSLVSGQDSLEYSLKSLLFQQANERQSWKQQYGETSQLYQYGVGIQKAELTQSLLNYYQNLADEMRAQQKQAETERIQAQMQAGQNQAKAQQDAIRKQIQAIGEQISAQQKLVSETERLSDKFWRLSRSLEEYRRNLWTGEDNLTGSRYQDAYSQFNSLYKKALAGDEEAFDELEGKAGELLQLGRDQLPERGEYNDLFYEVDQKLKQAQVYAESQATEADRQLEAMNKLLDALNSQKDALQASLDGISARLENQQSALQAQLDALNRQGETQAKSQLTLQEIEKVIGILQIALLAQTGRGVTDCATVSSQTPIYGSTGWYSDEQIIAARTKLQNDTNWQGRSNWTDAETKALILKNNKSIEAWYKSWGKREIGEGIAETSTASDYTNVLLDRNQKQGIKNDNANTELLNSSLLQQILATSDLSGVIGYMDGNITGAVGSMSGSLAGLLGNLDGNVTGALGIMDGSLTGGLGSANTSLETIIAKLILLNDSFLSMGPTSGSSADSGSNTGSTGNSASASVSYSPFRNEADMLAKYAMILIQDKFEGRTDWNIITAAERIKKDYASVADWWTQAGKNEDWITRATASASNSNTNTATGSTGTGSSGGNASAAIGSANGDPNILGGVVTAKRLATPTGIYGSYYPGETDLLNARATVMNATRYEGRTNWTANDFLKIIRSQGMTVETWYKNHGKAEGYAMGGITPANKLYVVGEQGPELMMSPRQWGVLNNEATNMLMEKDSRPELPVAPANGGMNIRELIAIRDTLLEQIGYLRQIVVKTDKVAYNTGRQLDYDRKWDDEGQPPVRQEEAEAMA